MLTRNLPLVSQVMNDLLLGISAGRYLHGADQLLSEEELSRTFQVSRSTVREALSRMEQGGYIIRRHGIGTFLNRQDKVIDTGLERLESIISLAKKHGLTVTMKELKVTERTATNEEASLFQLPVNTSVCEVHRILLSSGQPIAFLVDILPADILSTARLNSSFVGSVLDFLLANNELPISHANTEIAASQISDRAIARQLGLMPKDQTLCFDSVLYTTDNKAIDHSYSYFVPGYFKFNIVRRLAGDIRPEVEPTIIKDNYLQPKFH